ncbi:MAG: cyclic nucleotide-binding domain-containing protein [Cyclobacteriaceae bacterium]|nr:cyclic nucleotide-binding domain-containing protein [Cyclobacteriaceae bacterium]
MLNETGHIPFDTKVKLLKKIQLFSDLHRPSLKKIADLVEETEYQKGHYIFRKGDEGDAVFIIALGSVSVRDGDFILSHLKEGDVFGEYALIDNKARSASILAEEPVRLLRLSHHDFSRLMENNKEILHGLLQVFVNRLRHQDQMEIQLSEKNAQISQQKEILVDLNEEKNHLIAIIAHDLRNPLSSTLSLAELLKSESENFTDDQKICIAGMIRALNRMNEMVKRILDVRSLEEKQGNLNLERTNISGLYQQAFLNFKDKIDKKGLNAVLNLNEVYAVIDKNYLLQVIENLISNAVKFSPENKNIYFNLWANEGKVYIGIKDEGPGISPEDQRKLFMKYQPLSAVPTGGESSTGIGLSIVKKFTEMMNGEVQCESTPGKGAKFIVSFDRA